MDRPAVDRRASAVLVCRLAQAGVVLMTGNAWIQLGLFLVLLVALIKPLGWYMARVYQGEPCGLERALGWLERLLYRAAGVDPHSEMTWRTYAVVLLLFNGIGLFTVYLLQRFQGVLPLNPQAL